ncbi:hypothetical protein SAMN04489726_1832 [Allokutzneria albata]|uniref:Uncharacterized protein n=1 Tax=Allokutzneria albata TaxID=211114 RepID=A0A1G9TJN0_ALLAB|nr:hypothetical protein SAMN04489726_1832 [Allokutzneria albata]
MRGPAAYSDVADRDVYSGRRGSWVDSATASPPPRGVHERVCFHCHTTHCPVDGYLNRCSGGVHGKCVDISGWTASLAKDLQGPVTFGPVVLALGGFEHTVKARCPGADMVGQPQDGSTTRTNTCEYCGRPLEPSACVEVVVPDSSYLHPDDSDQDGCRRARACSQRHAEMLMAAGERQWDDRQLWAKKLARVSGEWNRTETTLEGMAVRAGLTYTQLLCAINWRTGDPRAGTWGTVQRRQPRQPSARSENQPPPETREKTIPPSPHENSDHRS